jgi:nitroreductase
MMELLDAIYTARTMRMLKPDPIPREVLNRVLDAAVRAGSAYNNQHWTFLVVTDPQQKKALADVYRQGAVHVHDGYAKRVLPPHVTPAENQKDLDSAMYLIEHYHEAPAIIVPCLYNVPIKVPWLNDEQNTLFVLRLAGASIYPAIQNLILAARSFGLGTVLTTLHLCYEEQVRRALGIPEDHLSFAMMPIGYPIEEFRRVTRKHVSKVTFENRWGTPWQA